MYNIYYQFDLRSTLRSFIYLDIVKINFSPLGKVNGNILLHNKPPIRGLPLSIRILEFQIEIPKNLGNNLGNLLRPVSLHLKLRGGDYHE